MFSVPEKYRLNEKNNFYSSTSADGNNGIFILKDRDLLVVASDGCSWQHVSVSHKNRCPTWEEMYFVKKLFWGPEDVVIQYHPAKKDYVNMHPNVLHLWRPINETIPLPPTYLV